MYASDKDLVFDADWVSNKGAFVLNRITLEAGPLYKFYEKSFGQRNDAYIEDQNYFLYLKSQCELDYSIKKTNINEKTFIINFIQSFLVKQ